MLIDTHAHVNFAQYKNDGDEVVKRALAEDVWLINVGSEKNTSRRAVEYAARYEQGVFAAVGLHPLHLSAQEINEKNGGEIMKFSADAENFVRDYYKNLAIGDRVVAIGEIGLDYYRNAAFKELQKKVLNEQLALAEELGKPVILHCREAHDDLIDILRIGRPAAGGVVHSFFGVGAQAEEYLAMGFYLGFNGIITFARDYDEIVKGAPLNKILLETDCPYLTPTPLRGRRNEPSYLKYVAQKIADLRGVSCDEIAAATTENARRLFKI